MHASFEDACLYFWHGWDEERPQARRRPYKRKAGVPSVGGGRSGRGPSKGAKAAKKDRDQGHPADGAANDPLSDIFEEMSMSQYAPSEGGLSEEAGESDPSHSNASEDGSDEDQAWRAEASVAFDAAEALGSDNEAVGTGRIPFDDPTIYDLELGFDIPPSPAAEINGPSPRRLDFGDAQEVASRAPDANPKPARAKETTSSSSSSSSSSIDFSDMDVAPMEHEASDEVEPQAAAESQPPEPAPGLVREPRAGKIADDRWDVEPNGSVRYNFRAENLVAHCSYHSGNCRRTRTVRAPTTFKNPGQGRPLGLLCAWLERAREYATAKEHSADCRPTLQQRVEARQRFEASEDAKAWADRFERAPDGGEEREPPDMT